MLSFQQNIIMHTKKEENRPIHRKEKWVESVSEEDQILDLKNKGLKSSISSLLKELEKVMYKELRKTMVYFICCPTKERIPIDINYKKDSDKYSRAENYNNK